MQVMMVVGGCAHDRAGLAVLGEIDLGVVRRQDVVCGANYGAGGGGCAGHIGYSRDIGM